MARSNAAYHHDVDSLIERTPLDAVLAHYGLPLSQKNSGEYRMNCVFDEACANSQYGRLTVSLSDPAKLIYCHSCEVRGSLLVLIHGLERHQPPSGGKLRGDEFKSAVAKLREIAGETLPAAPAGTEAPPQAAAALSSPTPTERNRPLRLHDNEGVRSLSTLHEDLIADVATMPPAAAAYFRQRPWLTPELCRKWGVGYLPRDGRSMFRGWVTYTQRDERGEVISYSGRDVAFEDNGATGCDKASPTTKSRPSTST